MNVLRKGLQSIKENNKTNSSTTKESVMFSKYYQKWKYGDGPAIENSYKDIPRFYFEVAEDDLKDETITSKLNLEARTLFLERMSKQLPSNEELESLRAILNEHGRENSECEDKIGYDEFKRVISKASNKLAKYYSAKVFAQLQEGKFMSDVDIVSLFAYAMKKTWQRKSRIGLSVYDSVGRGYLREVELESFITDIIPDCPKLSGLRQAFHPFYVCTVVRKFMFFLDPKRTGKVRLKDILSSNFLDDLLALQSDKSREEPEEANWFSSASALQVYGQYLALDKDNNGMLSKKELSAYGTGTLTEVFIERIFQEFLTYDGEMDYKSYLDFVLAMENKQEFQSLRYFFVVLDINQKGYLDAFSINYFFRGIQEEMRKHKQEPISFRDIKDELYDMVRPKDPMRITLEDLVNCQNAEYFVNILTDLNEFWNYENRECY